MTLDIHAATKIFYIDDDHDDLDFFNTACEEIGESVELFNLPDEMVKTLQNPPPAPSVIFLDLNMPYKTGFDIILELRESEAFSNLPLIVYSTAGGSETIKKCYNLGASMYVVKPTSIANLKKAIRHVVEIDWQNHVISETNFLYQS